MPRTGRGGKRQGTPGTAYPNRTDLRQAPQAATGQEYGKAGAQLASQAVVPLSAGPSVPTGQPTGQPMQPTSPLMRPSERPGEPVTAGLASGLGPGPEALGGDDTSLRLRAILSAFPTADLLALVLEDEERR